MKMKWRSWVCLKEVLVHISPLIAEIWLPRECVLFGLGIMYKPYSDTVF